MVFTDIFGGNRYRKLRPSPPFQISGHAPEFLNLICSWRLSWQNSSEQSRTRLLNNCNKVSDKVTWVEVKNYVNARKSVRAVDCRAFWLVRLTKCVRYYRWENLDGKQFTVENNLQWKTAVTDTFYFTLISAPNTKPTWKKLRYLRIGCKENT